MSKRETPNMVLIWYHGADRPVVHWVTRIGRLWLRYEIWRSKGTDFGPHRWAFIDDYPELLPNDYYS